MVGCNVDGECAVCNESMCRAENASCGILITGQPGGYWCKYLKNRVGLLYCHRLDNKLHSRLLFNITVTLVAILYSCFTHLTVLCCIISNTVNYVYIADMDPLAQWHIVVLAVLVEYICGGFNFTLASHWYKPMWFFNKIKHLG